MAANDVPVPAHISSDKEDTMDLEQVQCKAKEVCKHTEEMVVATKLKNDMRSLIERRPMRSENTRMRSSWKLNANAR